MVATSRRMSALGLVTGTAGNVSARIAGGFLVTPSGVPYDEMTPADIVAMDFAGQARGALAPSSEWRIHRDVLAARGEVNAVVHAHPMFSTVLACLRRGIPAFHYMVAAAGGGSIRCAPYATFGTQALSDAALAALAGRRACLLANHGMIALGPSLEAALALAVEVETLAEQYWRASLAGRPAILAAGEMDRVLEAFKTYGRKPRRKGRGRA
ncbi:MAG: class II aldolase/adducin family protein [Proteobacteria bacterium]|nr:class II aldolase/adducin family protein [Pseudomonadota bacterium]